MDRDAFGKLPRMVFDSPDGLIHFAGGCPAGSTRRRIFFVDSTYIV